MNLEVFRYQERLKQLFSMYDTLPDDYAVRANWAKYLCVITAGYIEHSVRVLCTDYAARTASPAVARHVQKGLSGFTNANAQRIVNLLATFDQDWARAFERDCPDDARAAVDSIIGLRHAIAHGRDVGVSYVVIKRYWELTQQAVSTVESQVSG